MLCHRPHPSYLHDMGHPTPNDAVASPQDASFIQGVSEDVCPGPTVWLEPWAVEGSNSFALGHLEMATSTGSLWAQRGNGCVKIRLPIQNHLRQTTSATKPSTLCIMHLEGKIENAIVSAYARHRHFLPEHFGPQPQRRIRQTINQIIKQPLCLKTGSSAEHG